MTHTVEFYSDASQTKSLLEYSTVPDRVKSTATSAYAFTKTFVKAQLYADAGGNRTGRARVPEVAFSAPHCGFCRLSPELRHCKLHSFRYKTIDLKLCNNLHVFQIIYNGFFKGSSASALGFQVSQCPAGCLCWRSSCVTQVCRKHCELQDSFCEQRTKCKKTFRELTCWASVADVQIIATLRKGIGRQTEAPRCCCCTQEEGSSSSPSSCWRRICKTVIEYTVCSLVLMRIDQQLVNPYPTQPLLTRGRSRQILQCQPSRRQESNRCSISSEASMGVIAIR